MHSAQPHPDTSVPLNLLEAVNQALRHAMEADENVVILGEDIATNGGVFRATEGLKETFGFRRVMDTPLAENLIAGLAVGATDQPRRPPAQPHPGPAELPAGDPRALRRRHPRPGTPQRKHRGPVCSYPGPAGSDSFFAGKGLWPAARRHRLPGPGGYHWIAVLPCVPART